MTKNFMNIAEYFKGIRVELRHVIWPNRRQTVTLTIIVIIASLAIGYYLGLFDLIFTEILKIII
jgi:preprotein translocase subunit SecE